MKKLKFQKLKELDEAIYTCHRAANELQAAKEAMTEGEPCLTKEIDKIREIIKDCRRRIKRYRNVRAVKLPPPDTDIGFVADNITKLETDLDEFQAIYRELRNKLRKEFKKINEFKTELQQKRNFTKRATEVEVIEQVTVHWPEWWTSKTANKSKSMHARWGGLDLDDKLSEYLRKIVRMPSKKI